MLVRRGGHGSPQLTGRTAVLRRAAARTTPRSTQLRLGAQTHAGRAAREGLTPANFRQVRRRKEPGPPCVLLGETDHLDCAERDDFVNISKTIRRSIGTGLAITVVTGGAAVADPPIPACSGASDPICVLALGWAEVHDNLSIGGSAPETTYNSTLLAALSAEPQNWTDDAAGGGPAFAAEGIGGALDDLLAGCSVESLPSAAYSKPHNVPDTYQYVRLEVSGGCSEPGRQYLAVRLGNSYSQLPPGPQAGDEWGPMALVERDSSTGTFAADASRSVEVVSTAGDHVRLRGTGHRLYWQAAWARADENGSVTEFSCLQADEVQGALTVQFVPAECPEIALAVEARAIEDASA